MYYPVLCLQKLYPPSFKYSLFSTWKTTESMTTIESLSIESL